MKFLLQMLIVVMVLSPIFLFAEEEKSGVTSSVVAIADSIVITQDDVKELRSFIEKGSQRTTEKEYLKFAILIRLFAEEAKQLGLDKDNQADISTFSGKGRLSELYMTKIIDSYVVRDDVIESYYLAHPDLYKTDSGETKSFDDDIKKQIREKVLVIKKKTIQDNEFDRLKQKYHLRICEGECK